jgi:tRNA U34 2-thiouridine synthase MnmA/TrmU
MKYILILLTTFLLQDVEAQKGGLQVSAQGKTIYVNLKDEDTGKLLSVNSKLKSAATGKLTIVNSEWSKEKDWKRTFEIYDDTDQSILKVLPNKTSGKYKVSLKNIVSKLKKGETYSLYTMAIPKDPKKAAVVRVRRVFVCRISIA